MSHHNLEKELISSLKLDTQGPLPKWQRKALENSTSSINNSLNISNNSVAVGNNGKTPSNSPARSKSPSRNKTPNQGDRFIPNRSGMQFEISHYKLTQENKDDCENLSPNKQEYKRIMNENLNGDMSNFKILSYQKKAQIPEGYTNDMKVLYSASKALSTVRKGTRFIPHLPERILDAPEIVDDYYLNLLDWNVNNILAVALAGHVYLWNAGTGEIEQLMELDEATEIVCSVSWVKEGTHLAIGTSLADVQLWDVEKLKRVRVMRGHTARIGSLSWNSYILSSGSRSGFIHHHDVRIAQHHVGTLHGHTQEVCGLEWSPDGQHLASGGNDNVLNIWSSAVNHNYNENHSLHSFSHQAAVKALAWCPWQSKILASGGGTADRTIKIWNCNLGTCLNSIDTKSQVCGLLWSKDYKELISAHGFANYELIIWKYPTMTKVAELTGHTARILNLAMSPDGSTVISAGADETLRLWKCFAIDNDKKKKETKTKGASSALHLAFSMR